MTFRHAVAASLLCAGLAFSAYAQEPTVLTLNRDHAADDCVWGPITIDHDQLAWATERPWKHAKPVWGTLLPGTYRAKATYLKGTGIELAFSDLPDQRKSVLVLGPRTKNGLGRLAIGNEIVGHCRVTSRKNYPAVAKRLNQRLFGAVQPANAQSVEVRVRILDR